MATYKLYFPNGNVQTYDSSSSLQDAARKMGGYAQSIVSCKDYVFVEK